VGCSGTLGSTATRRMRPAATEMGVRPSHGFAWPPCLAPPRGLARSATSLATWQGAEVHAGVS
jgi:hypothetical protein